MWKNIKSSCNNNKFKISVPKWNDKLELPDGSYSVPNIQDYFEYILKKYGANTDKPSVQIYVNFKTLKYGSQIKIFNRQRQKTE